MKKKIIFIQILLLTPIISYLLHKSFLYDKEKNILKNEIKFLKYMNNCYKDNITFFGNSFGKIFEPPLDKLVFKKSPNARFYLVFIKGVNSPVNELIKIYSYTNSKISEFKNVDMKFIFILPPNQVKSLIEYLKTKKISVITDRYFEYFAKYRVKMQQTPVLLLDENFICRYGFLIHNDNIIPSLFDANVIINYCNIKNESSQ